MAVDRMPGCWVGGWKERIAGQRRGQYVMPICGVMAVLIDEGMLGWIGDEDRLKLSRGLGRQAG